jgi:gliding motility-associated-like protein
MISSLRYDILKACTWCVFICFAPRTGAQDCNKYPMRLTTTIIVNPSFEARTDICPNFVLGNVGNKVIDNVPGWQLATVFGNTWYFGECNNFVFEPPLPVFPKVPQPIPDGKGVLTFFDHEGGGRFPAKTYLSNCLASPLLSRYPYTLKFSLGFGTTNDQFDTVARYESLRPFFNKKTGKSPAKVTLYGHESCSAVPAASPVLGSYDCLTRYKQDWIELGTVTVTGDSGTWAEAEISFIPPKNITLIAIGPACDSKNAQSEFTQDFYTIDHLRLYKSSVAKPFIFSSPPCEDQGDLSTVTLYASHHVDEIKPSKYIWYRNNVEIASIQSNNLIVIQKNKSGPGWYQCALVNDSVCFKTDSFYVDWIQSPKSLGPDTTACTGDMISLDVTTQQATYLWDDGSTLPTRSVSQSGTYSVTVSNTCKTVTSARKITFNDCATGIILPSAFTPNHDGLNDVLKPALKLAVKRFRFSVYNRVGQMVFTSSAPGEGWDGTLNRVQQPGGTYIWVVDYIDTDGIPRTKKGTVVLIR